MDALVGLLEKRLQVYIGDGTVTIMIDWANDEMAFRLVEAAQQNFLEARHVSEISSISEAISILEGHASGVREVIAFTTGERENQGAWENLLADIKARGVHEIGLWITDGHQAMLNAIVLKFPFSQRQRCIKHKMDNVLSHVPEKQREEVRQELRAIFYQKSRAQADQLCAKLLAKGSACVVLKN